MKKKELEKTKEKSIKELYAEVLDLKRKNASISAKIAVGREKNLKAGKVLRRQIAQIMTVISGKEKAK